MECWRSVPGYEGLYEVSDLGRVQSLPRRARRGDHFLDVPGRLLKLTRKDTGHLVCGLSANGKTRLVYVHRLVLEAFAGPAPDGTEACHRNDIPTDNRLSNLRWDTSSGNKYDASRNGRNWLANKTHCARGHEFTPSNTYRRPSGHRQCRRCGIDATRRWEARTREKAAS